MTKINHNYLERKVGRMISKMSKDERIEVTILPREISDFIQHHSTFCIPTSGEELYKVLERSLEDLAQICEEREILYKKESCYIRANVNGKDLAALLQNKKKVKDIRPYQKEED